MAKRLGRFQPAHAEGANHTRTLQQVTCKHSQPALALCSSASCRPGLQSVHHAVMHMYDGRFAQGCTQDPLQTPRTKPMHFCGSIRLAAHWWHATSNQNCNGSTLHGGSTTAIVPCLELNNGCHVLRPFLWLCFASCRRTHKWNQTQSLRSQ
eukprot:GHRQ01026532.1.p1 GENE.GHRQ01026532.1~~GHRQ01026532.1.p1  ORF type:complete len:152 (-),score=1.60 GHRQ01026532.1:816-1271(-)